MRRTNQRFNKRNKVRESVEERLVYAEKLNDLLARSSAVQVHINKELRGKYTNLASRVARLSDHMTTLTSNVMDDDDDPKNETRDLAIANLSEKLNALSDNVDIMADELEDLS